MSVPKLHVAMAIAAEGSDGAPPDPAECVEEAQAGAEPGGRLNPSG